MKTNDETEATVPVIRVYIGHGGKPPTEAEQHQMLIGAGAVG